MQTNLQSPLVKGSFINSTHFLTNIPTSTYLNFRIRKDETTITPPLFRYITKLIHSNITGGSTQIVTVTDPKTGKPVQQIIQTKIDPKTGKPVQVVSKAPANAQIVTVTDPDTGQPVQMMVDPKTGKKVPVAANPAAPGGNTQIVMVKDPVTGQKVPQVVQTVVDPKTGKKVQVPVQTTASPAGAGGATPQIVTVTDPKTGKPVQQIVQTVIDPATGKPTQVMTPLSNTQNGNLIISHIHLLKISDLPWADYICFLIWNAMNFEKD